MKNFLYDIAEAQKRIKETGGRYKIFNISDLVLNDDDFKLAWKVYRSESSIIFGEDSELTSEGVFHGLVYCLLTPLQNYFGQSKGFEAFFNEGLATPEKIQENLGMLGVVFKEAKVMFPDQKANYIEIAAQNWNNLNLLEKIGRSVNTDREQETHLRKNIVENVKGLGNKTASILLRMCGLKYLVPIDSWMAEILYFNGYPCEIPRSKANRIQFGTKDVLSVKQRKRELKEEKYLEMEEFALDLAKKYESPGHILQLAFWAKKSSFNKENIKP